MATSVPEPMASPRSAAASAGPSLTPSPTMATDRPCACRSVITATLSAGIAPAITSSMPASAATASAVASLSPVSRIVRRPRRRSAATAPAAEGLTVSATATAPRAWPSHPASTTVRPGPLPRHALRGQPGRDIQPAVAEQFFSPNDHLVAVHGAARAQPRQSREAIGLRQRPEFGAGGGADRGGHRMLGGLLHRPGVPEQDIAAGARGLRHAGHRHHARGDRSGLVQHHGVHRAGRLQRLVPLDEDPQLRPPPAGHHQRRRGRQAERARARDDQDGQGGAERLLGRAARHQPARQGQPRPARG